MLTASGWWYDVRLGEATHPNSPLARFLQRGQWEGVGGDVGSIVAAAEIPWVGRSEPAAGVRGAGDNLPGFSASAPPSQLNFEAIED